MVIGNGKVHKQTYLLSISKQIFQTNLMIKRIKLNVSNVGMAYVFGTCSCCVLIILRIGVVVCTADLYNKLKIKTCIDMFVYFHTGAFLQIRKTLLMLVICIGTTF